MPVIADPRPAHVFIQKLLHHVLLSLLVVDHRVILGICRHNFSAHGSVNLFEDGPGIAELAKRVIFAGGFDWQNDGRICEERDWVGYFVSHVSSGEMERWGQ